MLRGGGSLRLPRLLLHACGSISSISTVSRSPASSELGGGRARPPHLDGCWGLAGRCGGLCSRPPGTLGMCSGGGLSQTQAFSRSACADSCLLALLCASSRTKPGVSKQAPLLVTGEDPVSLRKPGLASRLSDPASVLSVACGQSERVAEKHHSLGKG